MIVTARDVYGERLPSAFDVHLETLGSRSRRRRQALDVPPSGRAEFSTAWQNAYRVRGVCEGHAEVARNVDGGTDAVELRLPVRPSAVVGFDWPAPPPEIPGVDAGAFAELEDRNRGTLLNVWAKLWAVHLGVIPAGAFVDRVLEVRVDRLICSVSAELLAALELAVESELLEVVTSAVGHRPPAGYCNGPSVKTHDDVGGLQISTFVTGDPGVPTLADIDIDEEAGFRHAVRALGHHVLGRKTRAVEVQQILELEGIATGWRPLIA